MDRRSYLILLIASGIIITLCMGIRQSLGLFMSPVTSDLAITAAAFGFSISVQNLMWGVAQPVVGAIADRHGARPVLMGTGLVFVLGLLLMASMQGTITLDLAGFLIGVGVAGTGFGILIGVVTRATPPEKRSQTVGAVAAAGSLGTVVIAPFAQSLIDRFGWRMSLVGLAVIALGMIALSLLVREPPKVVTQAAGVAKEGFRDAVRIATSHRGFMAMATAYFACGFQLIFIGTHLPQYLELCGQSPSLGATALGTIGLFNTIGTYSVGLLGARYSQKRLLAYLYLFRTIAIAAFLYFPVTPTTTLVFAAVMGLLWLGVAPLVTGIVSRIFGLTHFNTIYGMAFLWHQVGSFAGAWIGGAVYDWTGKYDFAWIALLVIGSIAFTLQWRMDDEPMRQNRPVVTPAAA